MTCRAASPEYFFLSPFSMETIHTMALGKRYGRWHFDIDIVGGCNLRCPSCPVGNSKDVSVARGYMSPDLLEKIVRKAISECEELKIALYNWTEPFLHPQLPDMIRVVRSFGVRCLVSTNLNIIRNIDAVLAAGPTWFRVSVSGFRQESYGVTHLRGDIERVKRNMVEVARAKQETAATAELELCYHRYLGNHDEEISMRQYAESLGFTFNPVWAYMMPLEKVLGYADGLSTGVPLTTEDRRLIDNLALPLDRALEVSRENAPKRCELMDHQMALTFTGDVMLCCSVYDQSKYKLGSYLDIPLDRLQRMKAAQNICTTCMEVGAHALAVYGNKTKLDRIAAENIANHYPDVRLPGMDKVRLRRRLRRKMKRAASAFNRLLKT